MHPSCFDFSVSSIMSADEDQSEHELMRNFKLENEDHTLGTLLTYILDQLPETEFCAYTIKHPTENVLYLRLKVKKGHDVTEIFKKGVIELKKALDIVEEKFINAMDEYENQRYIDPTFNSNYQPHSDFCSDTRILSPVEFHRKFTAIGRPTCGRSPCRGRWSSQSRSVERIRHHLPNFPVLMRRTVTLYFLFICFF